MFQKLHENFRNYIQEQELIESRLSDLKEKYAHISDWVNFFAAADPSGKNKYLQWMVKTFDKNIDENSSTEFKQEIAGKIYQLTKAFHKNAQRMPKKDINQYKSWEELERDIQSLGKTQKEKRSKEKEEAMEGSEIIYEDENFFVVRPNTEEASCFYGRNTKWCISATKSHNYYNQYSGEGKLFYFLRNENLEESSAGKKLAFVVDYNDGDAGLSEIFDAEDDSIEKDEAKGWIHENLFGDDIDLKSEKQIEEVENAFIDLVREMEEHASENPPDFSNVEAQIDEIKDNYNNEAKHSMIDYDFDGDNIQDIYMRGDMVVELESIKGWTVDLDEIEEEQIDEPFRKALDDAYIYPQDINYDDFFDTTMPQIYLSFSPESFEQNVVERFESFANEMSEYDKNYDEMIETFRELLAEKGLIKGAAKDTLEKWLSVVKSMNFKNMKVDTVSGDLDFHIPLTIVGLPKSDSKRDQLKQILRSSYLKRDFEEIVQRYLDRINKEFEKQLSLFENKTPRMIPGYTLHSSKIGDNAIHFTLSFSINWRELVDDVDANDFVQTMKWFDDQHDKIQELFTKAVQKHLASNYPDRDFVNESVDYHTLCKRWKKHILNS
jgi:ribosomal protein S17E